MIQSSQLLSWVLFFSIASVYCFLHAYRALRPRSELITRLMPRNLYVQSCLFLLIGLLLDGAVLPAQGTTHALPWFLGYVAVLWIVCYAAWCRRAGDTWAVVCTDEAQFSAIVDKALVQCGIQPSGSLTSFDVGGGLRLRILFDPRQADDIGYLVWEPRSRGALPKLVEARLLEQLQLTRPRRSLWPALQGLGVGAVTGGLALLFVWRMTW